MFLRFLSKIALITAVVFITPAITSPIPNVPWWYVAPLFWGGLFLSSTIDDIVKTEEENE